MIYCIRIILQIALYFARVEGVIDAILSSNGPRDEALPALGGLDPVIAPKKELVTMRVEHPQKNRVTTSAQAAVIPLMLALVLAVMPMHSSQRGGRETRQCWQCWG